ncbi:unnamed protein product [Victoria cruziana]
MGTGAHTEREHALIACLSASLMRSWGGIPKGDTGSSFVLLLPDRWLSTDYEKETAIWVARLTASGPSDRQAAFQQNVIVIYSQ